jgi:hypothetical protein
MLYADNIENKLFFSNKDKNYLDLLQFCNIVKFQRFLNNEKW